VPRFKQIEIDVEVNRAIEQARLSFAESENEILRRLLLKSRVAKTAIHARAPAPPSPQGPPRARGLWTVELSGARESAANLRDAYGLLLRRLAERFPDFLERFSHEKARSRRFVARNGLHLYGTAPHLAGKHAKPLVDGWFFDTNLSTVQVAQRVRIAARLCGLPYGKDVRILDDLREI
jgi:hypothetical protein